MMDNIFTDIGLIIIVATAFGFALKAFRQPLIPAYVLAGLLLGPVMHVITNEGIITTLSEIGIAFLLFIVGLEIDLSKLKSVGRVSTLGGLAKSLLLFTSGFVFMLLLHFRTIEAVYMGLIIAFSSTMVVIKILADKKELDTLPARIIVGLLLFEDILAILALSILSSVNGFSFIMLLVALWKAAFLFVIAVAATRYVFPYLFRFAARNNELLFLASISTCFLFALFFAYLDFSISVGAFVGGVVLANLPYNFEIMARVKPMRDFFSTIFFVSLGMSIVKISQQYLLMVIALLLLIWVAKPLFTFLIVALFGFKSRVAFIAGISLSQVSEFSLILATQGLILGHLGKEFFSIVAILVVVTMSTTSYFIRLEHRIFRYYEHVFRRFDRITTGNLERRKHQNYDVVLIGYDRTGYAIARKIHLLDKKLLVIDYNPEVIAKLKKEGIHCIFGDISEPEILEHINFKAVGMIVSTIPDRETSKLLITKAKEANRDCLVYVTAYRIEDALQLYRTKADYVIIPHHLGGEYASNMIERLGTDRSRITAQKLIHLEDLRERYFLGH